MTSVGGTFVVGVSTHQDPVLAALDLDLEPAAAGTLARIFHGFLGWTGKRAELAQGLNLSDNALRAVLNVLEARGVAVRERFNVGGAWVYAVAVSDTPGLLPTRAELREIFRNMADGDTTWSDAHQAVTPTRPAARSLNPQLGLTSGVTASSQVTTYAGIGHVNRFPLPPSAGPRRGMAAAGQPVEPVVPESAEVRAHATASAPASRSVISTLEELAALAKLRGAKPADGGRWRSSREVLAAAQALDPDMAEAGLAVLAHLDLPFWVAPEVWSLFGYGWTPDRVAELLADVDQAKSPHGAARYRLGKAAAEAARGELAQPPAPAAAAAPTVDDLVARDANHTTPTWDQAKAADPAYDPADPADVAAGAAPWDRAAAERARHGFGWRAPAVPEAPDVQDVYRRQAEIRAEAGGTDAPEGKGRAILDRWKAARKDGTDNTQGWVDEALAVV